MAIRDREIVIALDARRAYSLTRRGIGKTLIDLYRVVAALRPEWRFVMFHHSREVEDPFEGLGNVESRRIGIEGHHSGLWTGLRLPLAAKMAQADLIHYPANIGSRWPVAPMVVTIHDLIPLEPEFAIPFPEGWARAVAVSAHKARRIVTASEYAKTQIVNKLGIPSAKITVNSWAADDRCEKITDPGELSRVRSSYAIPAERPYVFAFAASNPRKNTGRILRAWSRLPDKLRSDYFLVLVGADDAAGRQFRSQVSELGISRSCSVHGFAPENDLPALLSGSVLLCYPSLSEGFGLPILDAFKCEIPVLAGNRTSLPEVAGGAAMLVDPYDENAIGAGLTDLFSDAALRSEMVQRGLKRLGDFSWQKCAERLCQAFEETLR